MSCIDNQTVAGRALHRQDGCPSELVHVTRECSRDRSVVRSFAQAPTSADPTPPRKEFEEDCFFFVTATPCLASEAGPSSFGASTSPQERIAHSFAAEVERLHGSQIRGFLF